MVIALWGLPLVLDTYVMHRVTRCHSTVGDGTRLHQKQQTNNLHVNKTLPYLAFAPGRPGPRIFWGPAQNPRPAPHHGAGRGTLATERGGAGPLFLPPGSFPVPGPRFIRGPARCTVCILSLICRSRLFFYGFSEKNWSPGVR